MYFYYSKLNKNIQKCLDCKIELSKMSFYKILFYRYSSKKYTCVKLETTKIPFMFSSHNFMMSYIG